MADINASLWGLERVLRGGSESSGRESQIAIVKRIEKDGTVIISYPGSDHEAPLASATSELAPGDYVPVTVRNGKAYAVEGNQSDPSIGGGAVNVMVNSVSEVAENAVRSAATAGAAASQAVASAETAAQAASETQDHLKSVVQGATTVEKAVSVMQTALEAVVDYDPTNDTVQEYFWHDANGAHVLGDTSGYRNDIDSMGMDIVTVSDERSVAKFGASGARIGKEYDAQAADNESHLEMDYHSMQLVDKEGNTFFHVSDLRGADGKATVSDRFISDGVRRVFELSLESDFANERWVTLDGQPPSFNYSVSYDRNTSLASIYNIDASSFYTPQSGVEVVITYTTESDIAKAYTFGTRDDNAKVGAFSIAEGADISADGMYAHAEGYGTKASGYISHAEGDSTSASGAYSHAEGFQSEASGTNAHAEGENTTASGSTSHAEGIETIASAVSSHAQNDTTIAASYAQTALGKFNVEDSNDTYAVIVGNGTGGNSRSNALAVVWDGSVESGISGAGSQSWLNISKGKAGLYVQKDRTDSTTSNYAVGAVVLETAGGGAWTIGNYNDETLRLVYISPTNRANNVNTVSTFTIPSTGILGQANGGTGQNSLYKLVTFTGTYATLNANAYTTVNLSASSSIPSGYSPVAFLKVDSGRDRASIARVGFSGSTLQVTVVNGTSTNITSSSTITVQVLYLPTAS